MEQQELQITWWKKAFDNVSRDYIVRFQLIMYCHFNNISVTDDNLEMLTILALEEEYQLKDFLQVLVRKKLSGSAEGARGTMRDIQKKGLIVTEGEYRKVIRLNPVMNIRTEGNIMVDIKLLSREQPAGD
jgi:hypothetical protein